MAHGSWLKAHGSSLMAQASAIMGHGSRPMAQGSWLVVKKNKNVALDNRLLNSFINSLVIDYIMALQWP